MEEWTRLCELLDDDPELVARVGRAVRAGRDADRWEELIGGLDDAGALAYLDAADSNIELADALAQLPRVFRSRADLEPVADGEEDLTAAIVRADAILAPHGLRIVHLEEEDAFPLVVVPLAHVDEIVALSARLGHPARTFD